MGATWYISVLPFSCLIFTRARALAQAICLNSGNFKTKKILLILQNLMPITCEQSESFAFFCVPCYFQPSAQKVSTLVISVATLDTHKNDFLFKGMWKE